MADPLFATDNQVRHSHKMFRAWIIIIRQDRSFLSGNFHSKILLWLRTGRAKLRVITAAHPWSNTVWRPISEPWVIRWFSIPVIGIMALCAVSDYGVYVIELIVSVPLAKRFTRLGSRPWNLFVCEALEFACIVYSVDSTVRAFCHRVWWSENNADDQCSWSDGSTWTFIMTLGQRRWKYVLMWILLFQLYQHRNGQIVRGSLSGGDGRNSRFVEICTYTTVEKCPISAFSQHSDVWVASHPDK
jgi:hypothetical protein